jgi:hypothetical protein
MYWILSFESKQAYNRLFFDDNVIERKSGKFPLKARTLAAVLNFLIANCL